MTAEASLQSRVTGEASFQSRVTAEASLERERVALRRALIMGASRRPIDVPAWLAGENARTGRLALVAALGLRSRFDHPAPPARLERAGFAHDAARLVSREARSELRRIYGAKKRAVGRAVTLRIVDVLAERGIQLHPFDYFVLAPILATRDEALDRNARLWLSLDAGAGATASPEAIDDDNWTMLRPAERAAFLRGRRREDPKAARELLAGTIAGETASVRVQLLEAMAVGLGPDDVELLRSLASDRAESVRALARGFMGRIPGTSEFDERLGTAHERLELKSVGIIGRRKVLGAKLPKGLPDAKVEAWIRDSFIDVSPDRLAERLALSRKDLVAALADERLRTLFFGNALALGEHSTALAIAASLELVEARRIVTAARASLSALEPSRRAEFWNAFAEVLSSASFESACGFAGELYEILRVPPPRAVLDLRQTAKPWKRWVEALESTPDRDEPEIPELVIALGDRTDRSAWRARVGELPPATASTALALADLFDALDLQLPPTP